MQSPARKSYLPYWGLAALILITAILYARTLGFPFVYDDTSQIAQNPTIRSWSYLPQYFTQQIWGYSNVWTNLYRPIFLINFRIAYGLFGTDPAGWHAFSLFVHLADICLVFFVARKLLRDEFAALAATAIFAVHPVQLETVAWISGMTDSLMAAPLLAGFWCYMEWRSSGLMRWLALSCSSFVLALMTKESGIVLLPLIVLYELTVGREDERHEQIRRLAMTGASLVAVAMVYFAVRWMVLGRLLGSPAADLSISTVLFTVPGVVLRYLRILVLPYGMSAFLPSNYVTSPSLTRFVLPLIAVLLIVAALLYWSKRAGKPEIAFTGLWPFIGMLPVLDFRMLQADDFVHIRFLYVASIGFSCLMAIAVRELIVVPKLRVATVGLIVVAFAAGTFAQMTYWQDADSLYHRGMALAPDNPVPKTNLASEYIRSGRDDEALPLLDDVLRKHPNYWTADYNRGSIAFRRQDWSNTAEYMHRAIRNGGLETDAYVYRGFALAKLGHATEGEQSIRQAIAQRPNAPKYHFVLGLVLRQEQRWPEALAAFEDELKINPRDRDSAVHVADLKRRIAQSATGK